MSIKTFEDSLIDHAKELSKDWSEKYNEPMDADEVEECADIIKNWLNYYQGNITVEELEVLKNKDLDVNT